MEFKDKFLCHYFEPEVLEVKDCACCDERPWCDESCGCSYGDICDRGPCWACEYAEAVIE